jgi:hypothetical protein
MDDVNVSNNLRQLAHGQVKALEYSSYDINGYHFWMAKLEASHPPIATTNNGVITSGEDTTSHITVSYGILQNIVEYMFGDAKELSTRSVDDFVMVELKHEMRYSCSIFCLHIRCNRCTT